MQNKLAYAAGLIGMAVLGVWMSIRRKRPVIDEVTLPALPAIDVDDDHAAQLIARYKPALERALSDPA